MQSAHPIRGLSALVVDLRHALDRQQDPTFGFLVEALHERGFGLLLLIFAAPMALPIPVPPGINVMLASPLVFLTAQQALGRHTIWFPRRLLDKPLSRGMSGLLGAMIPWLEKIETLLRPRFGWITQDGPSQLFGFLGLLMALTVMIPLPMTNTIPSLGIALMALGTIMRDGAAVLAGAVVGMGWITILLCGIIFLGPEAVDIIRETIRSIL